MKAKEMQRLFRPTSATRIEITRGKHCPVKRGEEWLEKTSKQLCPLKLKMETFFITKLTWTWDRDHLPETLFSEFKVKLWISRASWFFWWQARRMCIQHPTYRQALFQSKFSHMYLLNNKVDCSTEGRDPGAEHRNSQKQAAGVH